MTVHSEAAQTRQDQASGYRMEGCIPGPTFRLAATFTGVYARFSANPPQPTLLGDWVGCCGCRFTASAAGRTYGPDLAVLLRPLLAGPPACLATSPDCMSYKAPHGAFSRMACKADFSRSYAWLHRHQTSFLSSDSGKMAELQSKVNECEAVVQQLDKVDGNRNLMLEQQYRSFIRFLGQIGAIRLVH